MSDKSTQAERRDLAGSTGSMTYHSRAAVEQTLESGGRFADKVSLVVGETPAVPYPRFPAGSPSSGDLVGDEPSLGFSVEAMEPTGEAHEVAASLATGSPVPVAEGSGAAPAVPSVVEPAPDPLTHELGEVIHRMVRKS